MWLLWAACCLVVVGAELIQEFEVAEGVPAGSLVGVIGRDTGTQPPYLIVPAPGSAVDSDLSIDQASGQVRTNVVLDRELRSEYSFVAIPPSGDNVRVTIRVLDINDNAPEFPVDSMSLEFPENTPRDVKRTLSPARDRDLGEFSTQHYRIASGNADGAFRLASHRERDDVLYLDLQISGALDREATPYYSLQVEAFDGGRPPLRGIMTVNITILDVNDNPPAFNQSRYVGRVPENASVGTAVLRVLATDADAGDNGRVRYAINRRQSDRDGLFAIDAESGLVSVSKPLDFEAKDTHELVVVARDCGEQPLEATAFVSVLLTDVNDNQPSINLIFLSDDASPKVSEDARPGELVARVSVNDPDSKAEYANVNVSLTGGEGHFGLATQDNIIYLVMVAQPLDRETRARYGMLLTATDQGSPPLNASRSFELAVTDTNDNAPEFDQDTYHASVLEVADPGTSVLQLTASDRDEGRNSLLRYSIQHTPDTYSQWFHVDPRTGLVTTRTPIDCETSPVPRVTVLATDGGEPPLSASATLLVTISDVNDNEPIFDQSFYNITVAEDEPVGKCVLRVSASDPDCGVNAMVNFTLGGGPSGGLSTMAMVKVYVRDVNDNRPIFYPREYNVSLREQDAAAAATPVAVVVASDADSGPFGTVSYHIVSGNDLGIFRVDPTSGKLWELLVVGRLGRSQPQHELLLTAQDGGGLRSLLNARVYISVLGRGQQPPLFQRPRYAFQVREDAAPSTVIGTVAAAAARAPGGQPQVRYSIYSGDPEGYFSIDAHLGSIRVERPLDHEAHPFLLLNVQATAGTQPPAYGHTQVNVTIWDVNDNAPHFESAVLKLSLPENVAVGTATYVAQAHDADAGRNGAVRYTLLEAPPGLFELGPRSGRLALLRPLDYETQPRLRLVLGAADGGTPAQSASMTLLVEVQDVNDNAPVFDRPTYSVSILESLPANSHFLQAWEATAVTETGIFPLAAASAHPVSQTCSFESELSSVHYNGFAYSHSPKIYAIEFGSLELPGSFADYVGADDDVAVCSEVSLDDIIETVRPDTAGTSAEEEMDDAAEASVSVPTYADVLCYVDHIRRFACARDEIGDLLPDVAAIERKLMRRGWANSRKKITDFFKRSHTWRSLVTVLHRSQVSATDRDTGNNARLTFRLTASTEFGIFPNSGLLYIREPLDREVCDLHWLSVVVIDNGSPALSATASVEVHVLDANDNAPEFSTSTLELVVPENVPAGHLVGQLQARDQDTGSNAVLHYSLLHANSSVFKIDPATALLFAEFVEADDDIAICGELSLDDAIAEALPDADTTATSDKDEDDAAAAADAVPTSFADMLRHIDGIRSYVCTRKATEDVLLDVAKLEGKLLRLGSKKVQKKLTDFF
ncbi:hypothetical protein HPB50_001583 [Hyalomma asiaticum]|uniref:Uncharacterized protein n=1 Tax=Hyalomma asiaticum TaxID=266040 RepID=A0ACB7SP28_HYAAI|nr:hypothetical protein HPB50_001583 [Hyalomma asiaticum]